MVQRHTLEAQGPSLSNYPELIQLCQLAPAITKIFVPFPWGCNWKVKQKKGVQILSSQKERAFSLVVQIFQAEPQVPSAKLPWPDVPDRCRYAVRESHNCPVSRCQEAEAVSLPSDNNLALIWSKSGPF